MPYKVIKRYQRIDDPDGNKLDWATRPLSHAAIERLDNRTPLKKFHGFDYRFSILGPDLSIVFRRWMYETFGEGMSMQSAKAYMELNVSLANVKWIYDVHDRYLSCQATYIYFNKDCETLINLKFR